MKGVRGLLNASNVAQKDVISTIPEEVITSILHCLPLQDAVKTSIFSKDWKFKWTMMTQLLFDKNFYDYLDKTGNGDLYQMIISRLLFLLNGAITKFVLYLPCSNEVDVVDINCWIIYVSKKGIKEFTFINMNEDEQLKLTTRLFSCLELTHLKLENCSLCLTNEFRGFPNLLSLDVSNVSFGRSKIQEFLTRSPLLEILKIRFAAKEKVKQTELSKLENLQILSLNLCQIEDMAIITSSNIFQLVGSLPKLQGPSLGFFECPILFDAEIRMPASLPRITTLNLDKISFRNGVVISCIIELIRGFPNLETLSIKGTYKDVHPLPAACSSKVDFSIMGQLQLLKVTLSYIRGLENEISLIKYLLDCSPLLKKMDIHADSSEVRKHGGANGEREFATNLLKLRRASPLAELDIVWT